jgi:hypothetical protein
MGSGGGLYSGAYQQAQDIGNRGQVQAESALHDSLFSFLGRNTARSSRPGPTSSWPASRPTARAWAGSTPTAVRAERGQPGAGEEAAVVKKPVVTEGRYRRSR